MRAAARLAAGLLLAAFAAANEARLHVPAADAHADAPAHAKPQRASYAPTGGLFRQILLAAERADGAHEDKAQRMAEVAAGVVQSADEDKAQQHIAKAAAEVVQSADELKAEIANKDAAETTEDDAEDDAEDATEDTPKVTLVAPQMSEDEMVAQMLKGARDTPKVALVTPHMSEDTMVSQMLEGAQAPQMSEDAMVHQMLQGAQAQARETLLARGSRVSPPAAAKVANWTNMKQGPPKGADDASRDEFVRKCTIVTTVSHKRMLPTTAVEALCRSTDQVVQCKMSLGNRLELLHERGRNMATFCTEAWDWFLDQYGDKCPKQCRKSQCMSTCSWLEANQDLKKEKAAINEKLSKVSSTLKAETTDALKAADVAQRAVTTQTRAIDQQKVVGKRAVKANSEAVEALKVQQKRAADMKQKLKTLEEEEGKLTGQVLVDIKIYAEWKRGFDKKNLQSEIASKRLKEMKDKIEPLSAKIAAQMVVLKTEKSEVEESQKTLATLKTQIDKAEKDLKEFGPKLEKAKASMKKAELTTNAAYESGDDMGSLRVLDQYLADEQANYQGYKVMMQKLEKQHREAKTDHDHLKKETDVLAKELKVNVAENKKSRDVRAKMKVEKLKLEEKKKGFDLAARKDKQQVTRMKEGVYLKEERLAKVKTTLKHVRPNNKEEQENLAKCEKDLSTAVANLSSSREALLKGEAELSKLKASEKEKTEVAKARKKKYESLTGGLSEWVAAHKARRTDLDSRMPEIVYKHKLHKKDGKIEAKKTQK